MSAPAAGSSSRAAKRYILLGLAATLVAAVVVGLVSAVLSPAAMRFSILKVEHVFLGGSSVGMYMTFTIAADPQGNRTGVRYSKLAVDLVRQEDLTLFIRSYTPAARFVGKMLPKEQRRPGRRWKNRVLLFIGHKNWDNATAGREKLSVQVRATVHFIVGVAYTRAFRIAVLCPLNFSLNTTDPVVLYPNKSSNGTCAEAGLITKYHDPSIQ
uniref:Late embryogenesis abundant protein LEA-2 subgroup domain-containing protein n=1 Tax=Oryza glumipatula TaxID=40148 RepID=A0A0E0A4A7_9ORYZ